jgi:hypothetical protein
VHGLVLVGRSAGRDHSHPRELQHAIERDREPLASTQMPSFVSVAPREPDEQRIEPLVEVLGVERNADHAHRRPATELELDRVTAGEQVRGLDEQQHEAVRIVELVGTERRPRLPEVELEPAVIDELDALLERGNESAGDIVGHGSAMLPRRAGAGRIPRTPATEPHAMTYPRLSLLSSCLTVTMLGTLACDLGPKAIGNIAGDETETGDGDGDDTDDGDGDSEPGDPGNGCGAETMSIITDLEAPLPGFDTNVLEILARSEGTYLGDFTWLENDGPAMVTHAGTTSPLAMAVAHEGGEIRLTEVELLGQFPNGQNGGVPCANTIEIDVALDFVTEDGLFNESMTAALKQFSGGDDDEFPSGPSFYFSLDFDAHQGTLALSDFAFTDAVVRDIIFAADFADADVSGSVNMEVEVMDFIGFGPVANFSATPQP